MPTASEHLPVLVWVLTVTVGVLAASVVVLGGLVARRLMKRPEEVEAAAKSAAGALGARIDSFGLQLSAHSVEARQANGEVMDLVGEVSLDVARIGERVAGLVARVDAHDDDYGSLYEEVARNRERSAVHDYELGHLRNRFDDDRKTPLPGPLPAMPTVRTRRRPGAPAPRRPGTAPIAPGARAVPRAGGLPPGEDDTD